MTLHLSRLFLDPSSRQVQAELLRPYEMHRTLSHAFPGLSKEQWEAARVLFRVDDDNERLSLLVQSHIAPDWAAFASHLKGRYLLGTPQSKGWQPQFSVGQTLRFLLLANPTFSPLVPGAVNKKGRFQSVRKGLFREAERLDWLRRQSEAHGFELSLVETTLHAPRDENGNRKPIPFRGFIEKETHVVQLPTCEVRDLNDGHRFPLKETAAQFSAARFDGTLRVTDAQTFAQAIVGGLGRAKGFGFGLLSVAPASK